MVIGGRRGGSKMPYKVSEHYDWALIKDGVIPDGGVAYTDAIDTSALMQKTVYVKADGAVTITIEGSWGENDFCELKTGDLGGGSAAEDSDLSWSCDDELICFPVYAHLRNMRVKLSNNSGGSVTVSVWVSGA